MRTLALSILLAASCAAPGVELMRQPGDFAFLEVTLEG